MIVCPACHAENPDGTKICVKCATELPKAQGAAKAKALPDETKKSGLRDWTRDLVDMMWLLLIIVLVLVGFTGEATHWTFHFTETQEAKLVQEPVATVKPNHPRHYARHNAPVDQKVPPPVVENPPVEYGSPDTFYQKGKQQYDTQHYQQSFNYLKKALEIDPTYAKAYFALGYLYGRFDMNDPAVRMYEMSLRFDPTNAQALNNLGMRFEKEGNYDDALDLLQKAVALDGQNPDYEFALGNAFLDKDQVPEALQAYQKAVELRPSDPQIYYEMALGYEKSGKKQDALDTWQKVIQYSSETEMSQNAQTHIKFLQEQS